MKIELKIGYQYIICNFYDSNAVYKILIKELTETTILYQNLDSLSQTPVRKHVDDFNINFKIMEELKYNAIDDFIASGNLIPVEYGR